MSANQLATTVHEPACFTSDEVFDLPVDDIVTYAFGRRHEIEPNTKIWVDALDDTQFVTYHQALMAIENLSVGFKEQGLSRGDCVCIHSYNKLQYPLLWLGTIAAGGIVTGTNPAYTVQELVHHFTTTQARFLIVHVDCCDAAVVAAQECGIATSNIFVLGRRESSEFTNLKSWNRLLDCEGHVADRHRFTDIDLQKDTTAVYAATSGTTGLPKAAELSHRYYVSQTASIEHHFKRRAQVSQLHCLPIFHAFAAPLAILVPLRLGITTYLLPRFKPVDYVAAIQRYQVTDVAIVPPIAVALHRLPPSEHRKLASLRYVISAGAPMSASVQKDFSDILHPDATVAQCWGCTEMGWITLFSYTERDFSGSVGRLLPNTILVVKDEHGHTITGEGVRGEAFIKSPSIFRRYKTTHDNRVNSGLVDSEGFYGTGDVVYVQNGKIFIDGRIKDIMKVNGWQVSPQELQHVVMQLEGCGVMDCVVTGVNQTTPDGLQVTLPRAYVVRSPSSPISAQDIIEHVKQHLVSYKQLTGGVVFVSRIPRTPTGKVQKRLLEHLPVLSERDSGRGVEKPQQQPTDIVDTWGHYALSAVIIPLCFMLGPLGLAITASVIRRRFH